MVTGTTRLGPYELLSKLGDGGMGVVYKAHDSRLNRLGAVKLLSVPGLQYLKAYCSFTSSWFASFAHPRGAPKSRTLWL